MNYSSIGKKGFTLLEAMVSITVIVAISLILIQIVIVQHRLTQTGSAAASLQTQIDISRQELEESIRIANSVLPGRTVDSGQFVTSSNELVLQIPAIDLKGNVIESVYDYIMFYLDREDSNKFLRYVDADPLSSRQSGRKQLTVDLDTLEFSFNSTGYIESSRVGIDLRLSKTVMGQEKVVHRNTIINLSNR